MNSIDTIDTPEAVDTGAELATIEDPEAGMATAEYAVGTVAATSLGGILVWIFEQDWFRELLSNVFRNVFTLL
ncbi:MAG: DUF4244 domain-containing protein [Flaviflexus sp.]|nr:DUF4244 domain-containing protein [Flaviflexus sp.]